MADTHPPTAAATNVEADLEAEDSAFEDNESQTSDRTSIVSDIMKYREENGRRYHGYKDGVYLVAHHVYTIGKEGKLYLAPMDNPARVLDVGTGTSIWALDFDDMNPESHVIGTDLSPIQPPWVAPNVEFIIEDAEDEWIGAP